MDINQILGELHGATETPHRPEGGAVTPLNGAGLDKSTPEPFPSTVSAAQGAGSSFSLTPGAQGQASDGTIQVGYKSSTLTQGPTTFPAFSSAPDKLTAGIVNRPEGGPDTQPATPAGAPTDQAAGVNPAFPTPTVKEAGK